MSSDRDLAQDRAPDSADPILGWRVWHLNRDGLLRPIIAGSGPWSPGTNEARCHLPDSRHRAPARNCVCGFNALHEMPEEFLGDSGHAVGVIAAWGEVDIYRTGFRAQYACVLGLLDDAPSGSFPQTKLEAAARAYGVPLLPLADLEQHAGSYAQPVSQMLQPGINRNPELVQRPMQPLPVAALPHRFEGRGVQINSHTAVEQRGRFMRLGPTPSLAALCADQVEPLVRPGEVVSAGDPLFLSYAGTCVTVGPSPVAGTVLSLNENPPRYEEGPAQRGWLVELRLEAESLDLSPIAWGRRGAEAYRENVLAAGSDADVLMTCAENPAPADALLDSDEGRAWLRAFAQQLDTALRDDEALCSALSSIGAGVRFEIEGLEVLRLAEPAVGARRWARCLPGRSEADGEAPDPDELRIELRPESLRRYWRGEIALAPDDVSVADADGGSGVEGARNPLHLLQGDRGRLLLVNSLHKRLFGATTAILDDLGNPWFKAGDALRDPVRNLEVLSGFEPPEGMADEVA